MFATQFLYLPSLWLQHVLYIGDSYTGQIVAPGDVP